MCIKQGAKTRIVMTPHKHNLFPLFLQKKNVICFLLYAFISLFSILSLILSQKYSLSSFFLKNNIKKSLVTTSSFFFLFYLPFSWVTKSATSSGTWLKPTKPQNLLILSTHVLQVYLQHHLPHHIMLISLCGSHS